MYEYIDELFLPIRRREEKIVRDHIKINNES